MFKLLNSKSYLNLARKEAIANATSIAIDMHKKNNTYYSDLIVFIRMKEAELLSNNGMKEHRYIASKSLVNKMSSAKIDMDNLPDVKPRYIHFEKGCFHSGSDEIRGVFFFCEDNNLYIHAQVVSSSGTDHIIYSLCATPEYNDLNKDFEFLEDEGSALDSKISRLCIVSSILDSTGKSNVKAGIWRNKFKHKGSVNLMQYSEPKKSISWHFRQLRNERYYRGEHESKELGSRWIFVCPDKSHDIKTFM